MRIRLRFSKFGKVRFTSHRDVARIWERTLRRAGLPVALTEGFSPRPKVHFGLALSTGHESHCEYFDVDLRAPEADLVDLAALPQTLTALLPVGMSVEAVAVIDRRETSLQQAVTSCVWALEVPDLSTADAELDLDRLRGSETLVVTRERKGQPVTDDIRPALLDMHAAPTDGVGTRLVVELATQPRGVRPAEFMAALQPPRPDPIELGGRVIRLVQWIDDGSAKREPLLAADATSSTHAPARAS